MAGDELFYVAVSEYLVSEDVVLDHLADHRAWSKDAYDRGVMLFSGRQSPPLGGVLSFRAPSAKAAEQFVASDPFVRAGVSRYIITAFTPTHFPWRSQAFDDFATGASRP
jgi:uncharacterized protein YciI